MLSHTKAFWENMQRNNNFIGTLW